MSKYDIGKTLTLLREELNLTQKEVAKAIYMDTSKLSRIENNSLVPSIDDLFILLNYYNIPFQSIDELNNQHNDQIVFLDNTFNKIVLHYQKYKNTNMNLIKQEIDVFKSFFSKANKEMNFNMQYNIQWFTQLSYMFPYHFPKKNLDLFKQHFLKIINKKRWLRADYIFISMSIPFLEQEYVQKAYEKVIIKDFDTLQQKHRRLFELLLENISDSFLRYQANSENNTKELQLIFNKWEAYIDIYNPIENKIIYNHNFSMYQFLTLKENKEKIWSDCKKRDNALRNLGLINLADSLYQEAESYYNKSNGDLNLMIFNS